MVPCDNRCVRIEPLNFTRSEDGRVLAGVAAGFARRHGVDPLVVLGALVALTFAAGLGVLLYALGSVVAGPPGSDLGEPHPPDTRRDLALGSITLGALLLVRSTGVWLGDSVMVPLVAVTAGAVVLGVVRSDLRTPGASGPLADFTSGRHSRARITIGASLVALGLVLVGFVDRISNTVRVGAFATALSLVGIAVAIGPWIANVAQTAADERRQRIRSQEREAMAAHLHDSVLQTLALIQRTADDPRRTAALARQQEHELRAWLYGDDPPTGSSFAADVQAVAREVEQKYDVRIEVVTVGDLPLDDDLRALCAGVREACVNAAKHSGVDRFAVYAEVGAEQVEVYVRDRGCGFNRAAAAADRQGIANSIEGRLERVGGEAVVESVVGEGTEVRFTLPRRAHVAHEVGT